MTDPSENAVHFEAIKLSLNQDKTGFILKLSIHPNDVPETLLRDWVGCRYVVAMVKTDDQGEIVVNPDAEKARKAVTMAGMLCANTTFQKYLAKVGIAANATEGDAIEGLRAFLKVESRAELKTNDAARKKFYGLVSAFESSATNNA